MTDFKYIVVLDLEANCLKDEVINPQEIIEFPCVVYDIENDTIYRTMDFSIFVKIDTPITEFCSELTSITQEQSDSGLPLNEVLKLHEKWMYENNLLNNSLIVTCGDWDLKNALPNHANYLKIKYPNYLKKWSNIKVIFQNFYKQKSGSMTNMLEFYNLTLDGSHHRGIDDCYNIAKIVQKMVQDGCEFMITRSIES